MKTENLLKTPVVITQETDNDYQKCSRQLCIFIYLKTRNTHI